MRDIGLSSWSAPNVKVIPPAMGISVAITAPTATILSHFELDHMKAPAQCLCGSLTGAASKMGIAVAGLHDLQFYMFSSR